MDLNLFGLSPSSIIFGDSSLLNYKKRTPPSNENNDDRKKGLLTLAEFVSEVPEKIQLRKVQSIPAGTKDDPVMKLFQ